MITPEKIIEALVFVSDVPMSPAAVAEIFHQEEFEHFEIDEAKAAVILNRLVDKYQEEEFTYELKRIAGGYQFLSKKEYFPYLHHAALLKNRKKLSTSALETLAIIAYKAPVTKTEVEYIRGVGSDYAIQKLLEKKLIEIKGRSEAPGRPLLYQTSTFFMDYFGINDPKDLPKLKEFKVDEEEYQEQFKVFVSENEELKDLITDEKVGEDQEE